MKLKRFIASVVATAVVGTTMVVTGVSMNADAVADTYTASLQGQIIETGFWDDSYASCSVSGDGTYSISYTYTGVGGTTNSEGTDTCLILKLDFNVYSVSSSGSLSETGIVIDINSVDLDGTSLNYNGSSSDSQAYRVDDDGSTIRHNIYNLWSGGQETTAIDNFTITEGQTITVKFTISGLDDAIYQAKVLAGEISEETTEAETTTTAATTTTSSDSDDDDDDTTTTTTSSDSDSSSDSGSDDSVSDEDTASATSDTGIAGIVLVCSLAGVGFIATRKKR